MNHLPDGDSESRPSSEDTTSRVHKLKRMLIIQDTDPASRRLWEITLVWDGGKLRTEVRSA